MPSSHTEDDWSSFFSQPPTFICSEINDVQSLDTYSLSIVYCVSIVNECMHIRGNWLKTLVISSHENALESFQFLIELRCKLKSCTNSFFLSSYSSFKLYSMSSFCCIVVDKLESISRYMKRDITIVFDLTKHIFSLKLSFFSSISKPFSQQF